MIVGACASVTGESQMQSVTFKQKLLAVVILSLMGIGYLGYVAFASLHTLDNTSSRVAHLTSLSDALANAQLELLTAENRVSQLQADGVADYRKTLRSLAQRYHDIFSRTDGQLKNPALKERLQKLVPLFNQYVQALKDELAAREALGFNNQSGALKPLADADRTLAKQLSPFNRLWQPFIVTEQLTAQFLVAPSQEAADKVESQLTAAIAKVKAAGFYDSSSKQIDAYQAALKKVIGAALKAGQQSVQLKQVDSAFMAEAGRTKDLLKKKLLVKARNAAAHATTSARWTLGLVSGGVALVITLILVAIGLGAAGTLRRIIRQVTAIADGDLTQRLPIQRNRNDEFDKVSAAVNTMTEDLQGVISQVINNQGELHSQARDLNSAVQVIAENNGSVSEQSTGLAGATEEISATTEQVAASVRSLRDDTASAHEAAANGGRTIREAMDSLTETAGVMQASAEQLKQLEQHSKDIDKVMSMINDLAEQTNLLALNAAIEAARAGEQGRGFAVVADEVRSLAERTGSATGEITRTVRAIQEQTQSVIGIMDQSRTSIDAVQKQGADARQAVEQIESQTRQASSTCSEITSAIEETARTTREMAANMDQIAQSIERNSDAIKAIVESSDSLQERSEAMGRMTAKFQLS